FERSQAAHLVHRAGDAASAQTQAGARTGGGLALFGGPIRCLGELAHRSWAYSMRRTHASKVRPSAAAGHTIQGVRWLGWGEGTLKPWMATRCSGKSTGTAFTAACSAMPGNTERVHSASCPSRKPAAVA